MKINRARPLSGMDAEMNFRESTQHQWIASIGSQRRLPTDAALSLHCNKFGNRHGNKFSNQHGNKFSNQHGNKIQQSTLKWIRHFSNQRGNNLHNPTNDREINNTHLLYSSTFYFWIQTAVRTLADLSWLVSCVAKLLGVFFYLITDNTSTCYIIHDAIHAAYNVLACEFSNTFILALNSLG